MNTCIFSFSLIFNSNLLCDLFLFDFRKPSLLTVLVFCLNYFKFVNHIGAQKNYICFLISSLEKYSVSQFFYDK